MQANSDVQPPPSSPTTTTTTTTTTPTRPVRSRRSTTTTTSSSTTSIQNSSSSSSRKKSSSTSSTSTKLEPRTRDTIIVKPIIYGNIAFHLGKKADITKTHKWTCYLRGIGRRRNYPQQQNQQQQNNENINQQQQNENNNSTVDENDEMLFDDDLSYIRKVVFTLHESFPDPIREVNSPPWEISEQGWGEFDIPIKIYFKDPSEKPITIVHSLTLFPKMIISPKKSENYTEQQQQQQLLGGPIVQNLAPKKVLVTEHYEELLFVNPRPQFYQILLSSAPNSANSANSNLSNTGSGGNVGEIVLAESEMPAAKKRRKNSKVTTSSSNGGSTGGGGNCLTHQSQIEAYAPKMDEKKDVELLVRTCRALDAKIRELNMELARKMEQQVSLAAPPSSSSSLSSSSHAS